MPRVVIVGAGISGLALAFRLRQQVPAAEVAVLEQQPRPGGTIWTERCEGFQIEFGPNGFLDSKPATLELCRELGLEGSLLAAKEEAAANRYLFLGGRLRRVPGGLLPFLWTDLLSWRGKLDLLLERWRPPRRDEGDESIADFARRRGGREVAEVLADAFVTGIFAGDVTQLSLPAAFPRLAALEREHGSLMEGLAASARQRRAEAHAQGKEVPRGRRMWSFREGLRLLVETLVARLPHPPVLGSPVRRLQRQDRLEAGRWLVVGKGQQEWSADAVVLTCPAHVQAPLLADLDADLAERIRGIPYNRVAVVALGYRRADVPHDLNGFGYLVPQRERADVLGVQWCSSLFPDRAPADCVLLRALCGGWHRSEMVDWDDQRLLQAVQGELRRALGIAAPAVFHQIVRWVRAIPQYVLGHLERVQWIEDRLSHHPGLFLGGNAYHGVALNDCVEQAQLLAEQVKGYLAGKG